MNSNGFHGMTEGTGQALLKAIQANTHYEKELLREVKQMHMLQFRQRRRF